MKKLIAIAFAGLLFSGSASAQGELGAALLGPNGVVDSLVTTLTTADAEPLVNSLAGANFGLIQGTGGDSLNDILGGLLVDQDPARIQHGVETLLDGLMSGLGSAFSDGGGFALPGLDGGLPGLDGLPGLSDGGLPGLPGGGGALSLDQLEQLTGLLSL